MGCKSGATEERTVETARRDANRQVFSSIFQLDFIFMIFGLKSANVTRCSLLPLYVSGCCCNIYLCGRGGNGVGFIDLLIV
jgi:hypothetical protein